MVKTFSSRELVDKKVFVGNEKVRRFGKVRACVFHPKANVCLGIMVHRPDFLWMFHRKDAFVALDAFDYADGEIYIRDMERAMDHAAEKRLGIDLDKCVIWNGLCVVTSKKEKIGYVHQVNFDRETGAVVDIIVDDGATKGALLGKRQIPSELIKGFSWGVGDKISVGKGEEDEDAPCGALVVDHSAKESGTKGGAAEAAGKATAVITHKVKTVAKAAKPTVDAGVKKAGEVANKGLFVTGRQLTRTKNMFSDFKNEYKKGIKGE